MCRKIIELCLVFIFNGKKIFRKLEIDTNFIKKFYEEDLLKFNIKYI